MEKAETLEAVAQELARLDKASLGFVRESVQISIDILRVEAVKRRGGDVYRDLADTDDARDALLRDILPFLEKHNDNQASAALIERVRRCVGPRINKRG